MKDSYITLYTHHQDLLRKEADLLHELLELDEMPRILAITVLNDNFSSVTSISLIVLFDNVLIFYI